VSRSVYIASPEGFTGKSAVALGLLDALTREVDSVGVFRPLTTSSGSDDVDLIVDLLVNQPGISQTYEEAFADLNRAIELDPRSGVAFAYRAVVYKLSGQTDVGVKDAETAEKLDPDGPEVLWAKGEIEEAQGRTEQAIADYKKAVALQPRLKLAADGLQRLAADTANAEDNINAKRTRRDGFDGHVIGIAQTDNRTLTKTFGEIGERRLQRFPASGIFDGKPFAGFFQFFFFLHHRLFALFLAGRGRRAIAIFRRRNFQCSVI